MPYNYVALFGALQIDPHSTRGIALEIVSSNDEVFQWSELDSGSTLQEGDVFSSDDYLGVSVGRAYDSDGEYYSVKLNGGVCYEELPSGTAVQCGFRDMIARYP